ncbi:MAG TPA: murein L,D-transpeptidase [Gammaproteobacteria bacterium]|nr:murein L,D-transpeptidase [Gammaproteobacteria bacterium]
MNTNRAIILAFVINLIYLCISGQAVAYQRSNLQPQNSYGIDTVSLSRLYYKPSDYLWIDQQQLKLEAYDALEFIAHSVNHGLNANDYHYDLLQHLDPMLSESEAHLFDLMLTDGLLKLISDISTGKLDPTIADPKWSIPRIQFDATAFLQQALSENHFKDSLVSLIPNSVQYRQLKAAAERYQNYVDQGGWSVITDMPELRLGDTDPGISDVRHRLAFEDKILDIGGAEQTDYFDTRLEQAVKRFQRHHSLQADGVIGPATIRAMNISAAERLQQIDINLERLRWLPADLGERYIMVNLANYRLTAIEDDEVKLDMRVIVGKTKRSTPSFSSKMTHVVLNPRWYIPNKLARIDLLPKQQRNANYFDRYNIRVFSTESGKKTEVDPDTIDWQSVSRQAFPYTLVQDPGRKNALGRLKFILPNPWRIYLHDTPSKSLFNRSKRMFSSGCIRVEDPFALADFSLRGNNTHQPLLDSIEDDKSYSTKLDQPLSVYAIYRTVWSSNGEIIFSPDSYHRDQRMAQYL